MASEVKLGQLITGDAERDAVHVAVCPVTAGERLSPGEHVGLMEDGAVWAVEPFVGVIDPFLKTKVQKGQRCYLLLFPNTVTSLRHEWSHPSFADVLRGERGEGPTDDVADGCNC